MPKLLLDGHHAETLSCTWRTLNLTSVTVSAGEGRAITSKYGPTLTSPNAGPYAINEIDENGSHLPFYYDTAGRQTMSVGGTIDWNEYGLPSAIYFPGPFAGNVTLFKYDGDHRRTVKNGNENITYIGGAYERHLGNNNTHVFNLITPNGILGQVVLTESYGVLAPATTSFFHPDVLGTPETVSDGVTGTIIDKMEYEPFGQRRDPSDLAGPVSLSSSRTVGFTGQEPDDEKTQLINMQGRIYDPTTTRFLTPDPLIQDPFFSQSLNSYAYVLNNPINLVDLTGFQDEDLGVTWTEPQDEDSGFFWTYDEIGGTNGPIDSDWDVRSLFSGPTVGTAAKADAARTTADAGPGWGGSTSATTHPSGQSLVANSGAFPASIPAGGLNASQQLAATDAWHDPNLGLEYVNVLVGQEAFGAYADPRFRLGHWYIETPQHSFGLGPFGATWGTDINWNPIVPKEQEYLLRNPAMTAITSHVGMGRDPDTGQLRPGWSEIRVYGREGFTERVNAQAIYGQPMGTYGLPGTGTCQEFCSDILQRTGAINVPLTSTQRFLSPEYNPSNAPTGFRYPFWERLMLNFSNVSAEDLP